MKVSVPTGDRKRSGMQFIETADKIEKRAMEVCRRWPKSWMFMITARTVSLASQVYEHAQNANAIFPVTTEEERKERVIELQRALGANYAFAKKDRTSIQPVSDLRREAERLTERNGREKQQTAGRIHDALLG